MCGILGIWQTGNAKLPLSSLTMALDRLKHRGPDDEGWLAAVLDGRRVIALKGEASPLDVTLPHIKAHLDEHFDVVLAHRRLAILDLSSHGHQPMSTPDGSLWITFNGEIYNFLELHDELSACGHSFHTAGDTEVILHAWQQWGPDCLHRFNGDWAFAILDLRSDREPQLFLARDRYGVKPLFFADTPEAFWFASEAKALIGTAAPFVPRERAVLRFLALGELPSGHDAETFFEGIQQLPPGEMIRVTHGGMERSRWYDIRTRTTAIKQPDTESAARELADKVTSAVRLRLRADVPVGSCLSGGVDSSSIVGTMRGLLDAAGPGEIHTFSAVYRKEGPFNERPWIDQVVDASRTIPHFCYPDDLPLADMFESMVWHQDEPFQTSSIFAQWCVMREARANNVIVLLDGQAADELFGGYHPGTYQEQFLDWITHGHRMKFLREWIARKRAMKLPWRTVFAELGQILSRGVTGALWVEDDQSTPLQKIDTAAIRREFAGALFDHGTAGEQELQAKLEEDEIKLARWKDKLKKKRDDAELIERIRKKKRQIETIKRRLALLQSHGLKRRWHAFREALPRVWSRLRGRTTHDLREYSLALTTKASLAHLLRFEDRNSMAFSIEARVPFTDFELVEWAFTSANDFKIHRGWTKWILRMAMKDRAPESILWRRDKVGFETPEADVTRTLLKSSAFQPAKSSFLSRYLNEEGANEICARVASGAATREEARLVWRWLVLDAWHRLFSKASEGAPGAGMSRLP